MRIVVNHLTRMQRGYICVAGVDLATGRHVRPVWGSQLRTKLLARHGGPFDLGCVVDLGRTRYVGRRPETEDHRFRPDAAAQLDDIAPGEFWEMLSRLARPTLAEIFGRDLRPRGPRSYAVDLDRGRASLGCLVIDARPRLYVGRRPGRPAKVRIAFRTGECDLDIGVTDIRLYGPDHVTPDPELVRQKARRLQATKQIILSVGLTRPFTSSDDQPPLHWLQVNNIHFEDDPCWKLGNAVESNADNPPARQSQHAE